MQQLLKVWGLKHVLYIDCGRCDRVGRCACSRCYGCGASSVW